MHIQNYNRVISGFVRWVVIELSQVNIKNLRLIHLILRRLGVDFKLMIKLDYMFNFD